MRKLLTSILGAVFALLLISPVLADSVGTAKGVDPQADAALDNASRTLVVGSDIFLGDKITTGENGLVQILFADNTKLVVGPNSSLTIDQYLLRGDGTVGKLAVDLLGGSFRFITGDSPKSAYEVNTPTGTIGVRGTKYDVWVDWVTGIAYAMVYTGEVILHEDGGDTDFLDGFCHIGIIDTEETNLLGNSNDIFGEEREDLKGWFQLSLDQSRLLPEFKVGHAGECTRRPPVAQTPPSLSAGGSQSCGGWDGLIGEDYYFPVNSCGQCPDGYEAGEGEGSGECWMNDY